MTKISVFSNKVTSVLLCLLACVLWGSLFPVIKVGYSSFGISQGDISSIILFAGLRFLISGMFLILISSTTQKKFNFPPKNSFKGILFASFFTIVLHYSFTYIALSFGEGSKSAIIKQIGFLFLSCFAFLLDREDKWSVRKMMAGILGFLGIIVTNSESSGFAFGIADFLLIISSFCSVFGSVVEKKTSKTVSSACFVAYSQLIGGVFLCITGLILDGRITYIDFNAIFVFAYICFASLSAYLLWNALLKYNNLSKLAVIKFAEPLFAVIFSGIILDENIFKMTYLLALLLILIAILIENLKLKEKNNRVK